MTDATPEESGPNPAVEPPDAPDASAPVTSRSRVAHTDRRGQHRARRPHRRRRLALVTLGSLLGVIVLIAAAGAGFLWYENGRIHRVYVKHLSKVRTTGIEKDVENILLIGSTTRCGLEQQNIAFGLCDEGVTGVNSDVVMILHLDPDHDRAAILSIPRDTFVPNARPEGVNKIDAALGSPDGPGQLIAAITDDFGIPIQHYVELNFDSFQGVVNALGGVKMYFPLPVFDAESGLNIPVAGCTTLDGFEALEVVRARHLQYDPSQDDGLPRYDWPYDPQSDLSRIRRDHEFMRVLASAVAARGLGNFVTDLQLINSVSGNLEVDSGFSATAMADLVLDFHNLDPEAVPQYTLPVVEDGQPYVYRGGGYGDVVFPVQPEDQAIVAQFLGSTPTQSASGQSLPAPGSFTVAVENGSGLYDQGARTAMALRQLGYDVVSVTNSLVPASTTETTVLYANPAAMDDALRVQSSLSGLAIIGYDPGLIVTEPSGADGTASAASGGGISSATSSTIDVGSTLPASTSADVVIVTGSNVAVSPPGNAVPADTVPSSTIPGSTSTSSTPVGQSGEASATTSPGPLADNPNLSAPSGATEPLEPWDPRSCSASGGPGP